MKQELITSKLLIIHSNVEKVYKNIREKKKKGKAEGV